VGLTTPLRKNNLVTKCDKGPRTWTDSLDKRSKLALLRIGTLLYSNSTSVVKPPGLIKHCKITDK
jgi:hypothetical protein